MKIIKLLELHARKKKINKIKLFNEIHKNFIPVVWKSSKFNIPLKNNENYEIIRIPYRNNENHTNLINPRQNKEYHADSTIQRQNHENHEKLNIPRQNQENQ